MTKRRRETRQRMLDAAFRTFADVGFGRTTVEQVCEAAGFTRGAFYSNFTSLDELFLAMWEQRSQQLIADLESALEAMEETDLEAGLVRVLDATPTDPEWFRISLEFTAHALRTPGLARAVAAREDAIRAAIMPILEQLLTAAGRRITDPGALGHALVAVHDGTLTQCVTDPSDDTAWARRRELFLHVVLAYTEETS